MNKTIRSNCFETNSSSSHSLTLCSGKELVNMRVDTNMIPDENNIIDLSNVSLSGTSPQNKAALLIQWFTRAGTADQTTLIKDIIKEHTGCKDVILMETEYKNGERITTVPVKQLSLTEEEYDELFDRGDNDDIIDDLNDVFEEFIMDGYGLYDISSDITTYMESPETIKKFIFSSQVEHGVESYYN